jgi:hypothetical protein
VGSEHHRGAFGMSIEGTGSCLAVGRNRKSGGFGACVGGVGAYPSSRTDRGDGQPQRPSRIRAGS